MTTNILPFGTSTDSPTNDLQQIKLFGCTVVDFNVSADWSAQGGGLTCKLIEDEYYRDPTTNEIVPDRLQIPVLGTPTLFELKKRPTYEFPNGEVVFQYIGLVDSFSRNSSNSKTYSVTLTSPLKILEATQVILDGYLGLGSAIEGSPYMNGLMGWDYGHNNSLINVLNRVPGVYHWWNVSNLINVYGMLENDDPAYRVPTSWENGNPTSYGGFGFSGKSEDGIPLVKLMWALHFGINHLLPVSLELRQQTHAGNLLYGRGNYDISLTSTDLEAYPYYYHFDAFHFYNQIRNLLGPQFRVAGQSKSLRDIISYLCDEANIEFYSYIDIYTEPTIGQQTLQEYDPNWNNGQPAVMNWLAGTNSKILDRRKFPLGGRYGGTIRIQTVNKNSFLNPYRPMSNIAYNLIGLEVPDIKEHLWTQSDSGIHPGKRPIYETRYGIDDNLVPYSEPLDSTGIPEGRNPMTFKGFTEVGTKSIANGGVFPVQSGDFDGISGSGIFDPDKLILPKIKNSDISIKTNDVTTMKIVTGGYQSRMVHVPGRMLRQYWGDIILPGNDVREIADTATDSLGLNELSTRKIPVVTPILDPRDVDDYILIDMKTLFGDFSCPGVLQNGIYAASVLEIRCAMKSEASWKAFFSKYKFQKLRNLMTCFYPGCLGGGGNPASKQAKEQSTENTNACNGLGYVGVSDYFGLGNTFSLSGGDGGADTLVDSFNHNNDESGIPKAPADVTNTPFGLGINLSCAAALANLKKNILPAIHEKVKSIGDTHYGKSWYAPVPYLMAIEDLDGNNLVGSFKRSWELTDAAYIEPYLYYSHEVPQSNLFISNGKVSPFVNWDNNFISASGPYDKSYAQEITNLVGQTNMVFNFSEYSIDKLCTTKYGSIDIIHASPDNVEQQYAFLPLAYERFYNRAVLPYSDITTGQTKKWTNDTSTTERRLVRTTPVNVVNEDGTMSTVEVGGYYVTGMAPLEAGQSGTQYFDVQVPDWNGQFNYRPEYSGNFTISPTGKPECDGIVAGQLGNNNGYFSYGLAHGVPALTQITWFQKVIPALASLDYLDNGRFSFPFVKFTTSRVFEPVPAPNSPVAQFPSTWGFNKFVGAELQRRQGIQCPSQNPSARPGGQHKQFLLTADQAVSILNPFPACMAPRSFHFPQISTRYVYGPWMTNLNTIVFRGKIEYEQDDSLVPENFLIPLNFGTFGEFNLSQTSGFAGMNLAAQGRANAIENFGLFALEEGTITIPGAPNIKRIGDSLYGIPQVTDVRISVSSDNIETTYTFKTIAPKFGKNTRDLEKKLTKISNDIKKLKLR